MKIESPCVNICELDRRGICIGCCRTVDEIARWSRMTENERLAVIATLVQRKPESREICQEESHE